jgi:hypothetical protein
MMHILKFISIALAVMAGIFIALYFLADDPSMVLRTQYMTITKTLGSICALGAAVTFLASPRKKINA